MYLWQQLYLGLRSLASVLLARLLMESNTRNNCSLHLQHSGPSPHSPLGKYGVTSLAETTVLLRSSISKAILSYLLDLDICPFWPSTLQPSASPRWMWTTMPAQRAFGVRLPAGFPSPQLSGRLKLTREPTSHKSPTPALSWTLRTWPWRLYPSSTTSQSTTHTPVWSRTALPKPRGISKWQVGSFTLSYGFIGVRVKPKLNSTTEMLCTRAQKAREFSSLRPSSQFPLRLHYIRRRLQKSI